MFERIFVMTARNFHIQNFQALLGGGGCYLFERRQIPSGEDIFIDPSGTAAVCAADTNRMQKGQTIGGQHSGETAKIAG